MAAAESEVGGEKMPAKITSAAEEIFESVFEEAMSTFKGPLAYLKDNMYQLAWKNNRERHEKTMTHARKFVCDVIQGFRVKHGVIAKEVEGSACDIFQKYFIDKMNADAVENMLEGSLDETKEEFIRKITAAKKSLEREKDKEPKTKSGLEDAISKTELFDPIHIHHSLLCCRVAYECQDPEHPEKSLENLGEKHLFSEMVVSYENNDVPRYLMARCGDVLYVTFRGIQLSLAGAYQNDWRGQVCSGIKEEAQKIPLGYFAREIYQERRIIFSGHSTGGTIAVLVVIYLLDKFRHLPKDYLKSKLKCITFGLLPVGDKALKNYVESFPGIKECFCHIVKKDDLVPSLCGDVWDKVQDLFLETLEDFVEIPPSPLVCLDDVSVLGKMSSSWKRIISWVREKGVLNMLLPIFDIFGMYYILDPTASDGQKYIKLDATQARAYLTLEQKNVFDICNAHLINHKIERYDHEVRICLIETPPSELEEFPTSCKVAKPDDILPSVNEVKFENIGDQVVAKIAGTRMWFVHRISVGDDPDLRVDYMKTRECEVQITMPRAHLLHSPLVSVRLKTHFENAKYMASKNVKARTMTYAVSSRQEQLAKHRPCDVIELAYLSALLERRDAEGESERYENIKTFFEDAVSVVPIESLFHAMASTKPRVVVQCCELFLSSGLPSPNEPSQFLLEGMKHAIKNIENNFLDTGSFIGRSRSEELNMIHAHMRVHKLPDDVLHVTMKKARDISSDAVKRMENNFLDTGSFIGRSRSEELNMIHAPMRVHKLPDDVLYVTMKKARDISSDAVKRMENFLRATNQSLSSRRPKCLCEKNLESVYPSAKPDSESEPSPSCCKAPMTLLRGGRNELDTFSERTNLSVETNGDSTITSNSNTLMLEALNGLRKNFETCSTLLAAFMEAQVQVPLETRSSRYVDAIAEGAKSFGLGVWGLLILPFPDLQSVINHLPGDCRMLVVNVAGTIYNLFDRLSGRKRQFSNYNGKLEFLLNSMQQSSVCNREFVSYSLERQLKEQCQKRNINERTPVDEILQQWQANFEDETLTLVPDRYRPLVARWIKWSLMISCLRESMAEQTAVGVIGLVNSGKSTFVRSLFDMKAITGTTALKRTTVPFIYNLDSDIKGLDVIDFPGVDDQDKSIPELAKLLLSLTRLVIFVVDYKRAHTQSTKEWLNVLEKENVPVLICLSFADKLYAELMGEAGNRDVDEVKEEIAAQFKNIKDQIGQPKVGHRDFKFVVFAFDNDSKLNCEEGKDKLRHAGLNDELDVGRWIAEKLEDDKQSELSQRVLKFIEERKTSTLNAHREATNRSDDQADQNNQEDESRSLSNWH